MIQCSHCRAWYNYDAHTTYRCDTHLAAWMDGWIMWMRGVWRIQCPVCGNMESIWILP